MPTELNENFNPLHQRPPKATLVVASHKQPQPKKAIAAASPKQTPKTPYQYGRKRGSNLPKGKKQLTKKQMRARAQNKRARKARRKQRKILKKHHG